MRDSKRLIITLTANKCASVLFSAKSLLPGLVLAVGMPSWVVAWIVPIRESLALIPQVVLSLILRRYPQRYVVWRLGMLIQILSTSAILAVCHHASQSDTVALSVSVVFIVCLATYSIGRSCCSLTVKDIQADIVDKGRRGELIGTATTLSGLVTILIAVPMGLVDKFQSEFSLLLIVALSAVMLTLTAVLMWPLKTTVETENSSDDPFQWHMLLPKLSPAAKRFIVVRAIFVHSALVAPFFMLAQAEQSQQLALLYLAAEAAAALLSAKIWGGLADKDARYVMRIGGVLAITACAGLMLLQPDSLWLSVVLFFALAIAHTGLRTGRKIYTLDIDEGQSRTELVGSANTLIGLVLLVAGSIYALLQPLLGQWIVAIMAAMIAIGVLATFALSSEKA
ncbi:MFS transporter [Alteromonas sp. ASW11-36]|uniref:MFS transporter n=1 Tax=Alteromonas arenosi TaxID=3055817 RepID=A0ABT7SZT9_9ALTE|nr:MFS transporter [Alteromonas sp. ASW11-36]MDM7861077.1 MFS transporter [Alteromonas sp. ASW11-36]